MKTTGSPRLRAGTWILCLLLTLSSCAKPQSERLSDREVAALREAHPYNDQTLSSLASYTEIDKTQFTFEDTLVNAKCSDPRYTVVAFTLTSNVDMLRANATFYDDPALNEQMQRLAPELSVIECPVMTAVVDEVLWQGECPLQAGDDIIIAFGAIMGIQTDRLDETYVKGWRYLCFLYDMTGEHNSLNADNYYLAGKQSSFYLLDDILLSVTSDYVVDELSGMSLPAFKELFYNTCAELNLTDERLVTE